MEEVDLKKFNKRLQIIETTERDEKVRDVAPSSASCNYISNPSMSWSSFPGNSTSSSSISILNFKGDNRQHGMVKFAAHRGFRVSSNPGDTLQQEGGELERSWLLSMSERKHLFALGGVDFT